MESFSQGKLRSRKVPLRESSLRESFSKESFCQRKFLNRFQDKPGCVLIRCILAPTDIFAATTHLLNTSKTQ
ncbi:hypothetical protein J6590_085912 [Homalodisca vitripennis]|nr:hypothetical protein J6590_085912 [Homalodisca vitripennis]